MVINEGYKLTETGIIPSDWEVKSLGEIGECIIGLTYDPKDIRADGILVLRSSNIDEGKLVYEDKVYVKTKIPEKLIAKHNDVLICVRNGSRNLIGKCALIDGVAIGNTFGAFMTVFRTKNAPFVFYQLQTHLIQKQIHENIGATINQITNKNLRSFVIPYPLDDFEQCSIAEALSDVDELISSLDALIVKKRAIKQGVMQELLTGKRRLPGFEGKWETKKLGEIVEIRKGQLITEDTATNGNIPVIAGGKQPSYFHSKANRTGKTITISASGANAGYISFHKQPIFASDCSTISENVKYDIEFIYQQLLLLQETIYKLQTGGAQPHVHPADLNPIDFMFPEKKEQQAISEVLSGVDDYIGTQEVRLLKIKALKKGMMQELLTGRIRLTGG